MTKAKVRVYTPKAKPKQLLLKPSLDEAALTAWLKTQADNPKQVLHGLERSFRVAILGGIAHDGAHVAALQVLDRLRVRGYKAYFMRQGSFTICMLRAVEPRDPIYIGVAKRNVGMDKANDKLGCAIACSRAFLHAASEGAYVLPNG